MYSGPGRGGVEMKGKSIFRPTPTKPGYPSLRYSVTEPIRIYSA